MRAFAPAWATTAWALICWTTRQARLSSTWAPMRRGTRPSPWTGWPASTRRAPSGRCPASRRSDDRVTGIVSVDNLLTGRPISAEDAGPLLALAHQVGTAIENARLHER